ncbi:unnamed protein product [Cladocopium goreaui]|uniref:B30.2/SPRY domain-containing protein n=1 Tax=Cladocopium goreaui TaxID=2562237 RepID=A0A9P1DV07_9DINO|nr:unnamed protein product [Cladocopium goreaui]
MEPPTKKARTDEGEPLEVAEGAQPAAVGLISTEPVLEPEELEFDDTSTGPKVKDKATFYVEDTTMNVLSSKYNTLMPLTDGGLQYLLAGARANLGVKTGRYMFEIRFLEVMAPLEDPNARAQVPQPRSQLRIGFASVKSNLFLGHSEHAIGFDNEGFLLHGKGRSQVSQKFSTGDVVAVVLNLNSASPNAHTISLFKNGKRASQPQALPEILKDKALYPILTFKNALATVTLHYNFGPHTMAPLPFKCRSINEVLQPDVSKKKEHTAHSEGQYEVWPPNGPPQKAEDVQTKIFPRSVLAPAEPRIPCPFSDPLIRRCSALLWAHLRRLHAHMAPSVQAELTNRLVHASKLGRAMISIASHGEGDRSGYLEVVRNCIMLQRCLVQAMDFNDSPLLQLPHVRSVPKGAPSFSEVLKSPEQSLLKRLGNFTEQQVLDIQCFCQHLPMVELSYSVEVNDEAEMAEGDMATLKVTFTRTNLSDSESAGPVHALFFPVVKHEEWWLLVYDKRGRRMIAADLVLGTGRVCKSSVNFIVPRPGDFEWSVIAMCDSYAGLDVTLDVHFRGKKKSEVDRSIFIHPEDAEIRSFFEELMMGLDQDHESDSEDEEDDSARQQQMHLGGKSWCKSE